MRNMSFAHTTDQVRNRTKTVTRRLGWQAAKPGDLIMACSKARGLGPGEIEAHKLCPIVITDVRRERLKEITEEDVILEGFPELCRRGFITMFVLSIGGSPDQWVTRLEFRYIAGGELKNAD